jgi:hypothetical protein
VVVGDAGRLDAERPSQRRGDALGRLLEVEILEQLLGRRCR